MGITMVVHRMTASSAPHINVLCQNCPALISLSHMKWK